MVVRFRPLARDLAFKKRGVISFERNHSGSFYWKETCRSESSGMPPKDPGVLPNLQGNLRGRVSEQGLVD
jgi:hypothetical protein